MDTPIHIGIVQDGNGNRLDVIMGDVFEAVHSATLRAYVYHMEVWENTNPEHRLPDPPSWDMYIRNRVDRKEVETR